MKIRLNQACIEKSGKYQCRRVPFNINRTQLLHWATRSKWNKAWHDAVKIGLVENHWDGRLVKAIAIVVYQTHLQDEDNLGSCCKPILDGLRYWGAIKNDDPKSLQLVIEQLKVNRRNDERVEIHL